MWDKKTREDRMKTKREPLNIVEALVIFMAGAVLIAWVFTRGM